MIYIPASAEKLIQKINNKPGGPRIKDIEHWRQEELNKTVHYAVVVLDDGWCGVGRAAPGGGDEYVRHIGFRIAVGRALRQVQMQYLPFQVDMELEGKDLYSECRRQVALAPASAFARFWNHVQNERDVQFGPLNLKVGGSHLHIAWIEQGGKIVESIGVIRENEGKPTWDTMPIHEVHPHGDN